MAHTRTVLSSEADTSLDWSLLTFTENITPYMCRAHSLQLRLSRDVGNHYLVPGVGESDVYLSRRCATYMPEENLVKDRARCHHQSLQAVPH